MNNKKTVVFLIPCLKIGGTEISTLNTAKALQSLGHDVEVFVYFHEFDAEMVNIFKISKIKVTFINKFGSKNIYSIFFVKNIINLLRRTQVDILWIQYITPTLLIFLIARIISRNCVGCIHTSISHYSFAQKIQIKFIMNFLSKGFFSVSHKTTLKLNAGLKVCGKKCLTIPNCVDKDFLISVTKDNLRARLKIPKTSVIAAFIGRLSPEKGPDILLAAAKTLIDGGYDLHVVFGGDGSEAARLRKDAEDFGISERIHFLGGLEHSTAISVMKDADVVITPSRHEGFGLTALEALFCNTKVIASNIEAFRLFSRHSNNITLFQPLNSSGLADSLCGHFDAPRKVFKPVENTSLERFTLTGMVDFLSSDHFFSRLISKT